MDGATGSSAAAEDAEVKKSPDASPKQWQCDFCKEALFDEYDDAVEHEKVCDKNGARNDVAVAVSDIKSGDEGEVAGDTAKARAVATEAAQLPPNGLPKSTNAKVRVTRFLIQNLRGKLGCATADFYLDLIYEKHGLYHLVSAVFDVLQQENLTNEGIESHLWDINLAGNSINSMGVTAASPIIGIFSALAKPLKTGQKGRISGESLTCDVIVKSVALRELNESDISVKVHTLYDEVVLGKRDDDVGNKKPRYPKVTKVKCEVSGAVDDDWINSTEKTQCARLQNSWQSYYQGYNSWTRDRVTGEHIRGKPVTPAWGPAEREIMGLLINADAKFKKSWTNIMQYAFPDRKEAGTSMKWYQLKKKDFYMIQSVGRGMTNDARIKLAKRLAKKRMKGFIDRGLPRKEPHPDTRIEKELRKRGKIDDSTSESERKRLCAMFRGIF